MKIISDIGLNANGCPNQCKLLIDACKSVGVDLIKFQMFFDVFKDLPKFNKHTWLEIIKYTEDTGIPWYATCFDRRSMDMCHELGMEIWKIPSGLSVNKTYVDTIIDYARIGDAQNNKIFFSTGISNQDDYKRTVSWIEDRLPEAYSEIVPFNCVSQYPSNPCDINLNVAHSWWEFEKVGLSDHSDGIIGYEVARLANAIDFDYLEKHITLDRKSTGPDHSSSWEPRHFEYFMQSLKYDNQILGSGKKARIPAAERNSILTRMEDVTRNLNGTS